MLKLLLLHFLIRFSLWNFHALGENLKNENHHHDQYNKTNFPLELVSLSESEYTQWYTHVERKIINDEVIDQNLCKSFEYHEPCWLVKSCPSPYTDRSGFHKGIKGYTNPHNNFIHELWSRLWKKNNNVTLLFIGDSLTVQRTRYFRDDTRRFCQNQTIVSECHNTDTTNCRSTHEGLTIGYQGEDSDINSYRIPFKNRVTSQSYVVRHVEMTERMGRKRRLAAKLLNRINYIEKRNCLMLVNLGVWFNKHDDFPLHVSRFYHWLLNITNAHGVNNKVIWLSPWPQHFNNSIGNGYYEVNKLLGDTCVPITNYSYNWRHNIIQEKLIINKKHLYTHELAAYIHSRARSVNTNILFYDDSHAMNELWDMHKRTDNDCTHYCYSPLLMQPLYDTIITVLKYLF